MAGGAHRRGLPSMWVFHNNINYLPLSVITHILADSAVGATHLIDYELPLGWQAGKPAPRRL